MLSILHSLSRGNSNRMSLLTSMLKILSHYLTSYGHREGMDQASKDMLKRDLFVQGILWKWQKVIHPPIHLMMHSIKLGSLKSKKDNSLTCTRGIKDPISSSHHTRRKCKPRHSLGREESSCSSTTTGGAQRQASRDSKLQKRPFKERCSVLAMAKK